MGGRGVAGLYFQWFAVSIFGIALSVPGGFPGSGLARAEATVLLEGSQAAAAPAAGSGTLSEADRTAQGGAEEQLARSYSVYTNAGVRRKDYLRAYLEITAVLGISAAYYYGTLGPPKDYEFQSFEEGLEGRFITGDAYRLDINSWETNVGHTIAGAGYYLMARSNNLSLGESLATAIGSSTIWELFGELQDEFSINDAVMTPFGGFAIGETLFQMGEFFQHSSDNIPNRTLGTLFNPVIAVHRWLDNDVPKEPRNVDKFGFTTDAWHRFRIYLGGGEAWSGETGKERAETRMGLHFQVVTAEKYGKPGEASMFYTDGVFNELSFNAGLDGGDDVDAQMLMKTAFMGYYRQNISGDAGSRNLEGNSLFIGLSSAFEYYGHTFPGMHRDDKQAVCDLLGLSLMTDYYHTGFHLRTTIDAYPSFSMVKPAAGDFYDYGHSLRGVQWVYQLGEYYYALGATAAGKVEMDYGPFSLEGQVRYHYFNSINGLDRCQNRVTNDLDFEDSRLWLQMVLYYSLPIDNWRLALNAERIMRWSSIESCSWDVNETRVFGSLVFEF